MHPPVVIVVSPPDIAIPSPFGLQSALPPLISHPMGRFRVLFSALAAPVHRCVVAEPELLLRGVSGVRAPAADYNRLILSFSPQRC